MKCLILVLFFGLLNACALIPKIETQSNCEGVLKNGQKQGQWHCRNIDTQKIIMTADFTNGKKDGRLELLYATGELESISHWKNGLLDGHFKSYHKNGQRHFEMYYTNGNRSEWFYEWDENGNLIQD